MKYPPCQCSTYDQIELPPHAQSAAVLPEVLLAEDCRDSAAVLPADRGEPAAKEWAEERNAMYDLGDSC
jgi:hypothetical protein